MGNWAKQQRKGAKSIVAVPTGTIFMTICERPNNLLLRPNYNATVNPLLFNATDFATLPNNLVPNSISQIAPNTLRLNYVVTVAAETHLVYNGSVVNVVTPQTIAIS